MSIENANPEPVPLVLDLHGWTGSAQSQVHDSGWKHLGKQEAIVIIWPDGMADSPNSMGTHFFLSFPFSSIKPKFYYRVLELFKFRRSSRTNL